MILFDPVGPESRRSLLCALLIATALSAINFSAAISISPAGGRIGQLGAIVKVFVAGMLAEPLLRLFRVALLKMRQDLVLGGW